MNHDKNDHDLSHKESSTGVASTVVEFMPSDLRCSGDSFLTFGVESNVNFTVCLKGNCQPLQTVGGPQDCWGHVVVHELWQMGRR